MYKISQLDWTVLSMLRTQAENQTSQQTVEGKTSRDCNSGGREILKSYLKPLCPLCGSGLAAKIGTVLVVCVICQVEFELVRKR